MVKLKKNLISFLSNNTNSFTLPGCNNQISIGKNEHGGSIFKPKKYVLWTFNELDTTLRGNLDPDLSNLVFNNLQLFTNSGIDLP